MNRINFNTVGLISMVLIICPLLLFGQAREPQNIYRNKVLSRYVVENGVRTAKFFAIAQEISDSLGRLHTEIFYDWETRYPNNYRWHYFDGLTKYKTDFFENEKLAKIEEYKWLANGKLEQLTVKRVKDDVQELIVREVYTYNPNGTIKQATGFGKDGKQGYKATYTFDANGTEILRKVKGKKLTPADSIMFLQRTPKYNEKGWIIEETIVVDKVGKGRSTTRNTYTYDDNKNVTEHYSYDGSGRLLFRKQFQYLKDNRLKMINIYNDKNVIVDCLSWRYEIYKSEDRRHRILE